MECSDEFVECILSIVDNYILARFLRMSTPTPGMVSFGKLDILLPRRLLSFGHLDAPTPGTSCYPSANGTPPIRSDFRHLRTSRLCCYTCKRGSRFHPAPGGHASRSPSPQAALAGSPPLLAVIKITSFGPVIRYDLARTLAGRGRYWTTAYRVGSLMIDTGCAHTASQLLQALAGAPLERIVNTHTHEDHIGANGLLQRSRPGLEILAHPLALPVLADPRGRQPLQPYRRLFWGWPTPSPGRALEDGATIESGPYAFQAIHTPGHSSDHLCLYEPRQGWLFSGDLFVGGQDRALRAGSDVRQIIASLRRVAALPAARLFPGSARVREEPARELAAKIAYLEEMGEQVLSLRRQGRSVGEIERLLFGGRMWVEWITLGHFSRRHLVLSFLGLDGEA